MSEMIDYETGEIIDNDATSGEDKPTLKELVERGVNLKRQAISIAEDIAEIAEQAKELYNTSKRDYNAFIKYTILKDIELEIEALNETKIKLQNLDNDEE